ncbi:MAG: hypothetical protein ACI4JB_05675 [Porcipelethomonas sp.]
MLRIFHRFFRRRKIINIYRKKRKKNYNSITQQHNTESPVFEIKRAVRTGEKSIIVCGKVRQGSFKTGDMVIISGSNNGSLKLEAIIERITTSLVEVNRIFSGSETDMLLEVIRDTGKIILPGNKILSHKTASLTGNIK